MSSSIFSQACNFTSHADGGSFKSISRGGGGRSFLCPIEHVLVTNRLQLLSVSRKGASRKARKESTCSHILASVTGVSVDKSIEIAELPKGDMWSVHKFGGTCVGTAKRIQNVADIILKDSSERKLIVVSAMSKVTDMMYDLIYKAQSRDSSYISALDDVFEKHKQTATELLDGNELASFLSQLHLDISNLKIMLRAIYIDYEWWTHDEGKKWAMENTIDGLYQVSLVATEGGLPCSNGDDRVNSLGFVRGTFSALQLDDDGRGKNRVLEDEQNGWMKEYNWKYGRKEASSNLVR